MTTSTAIEMVKLDNEIMTIVIIMMIMPIRRRIIEKHNISANDITVNDKMVLHDENNDKCNNNNE